MLNSLLQSHPAFIPIESLAIIWDFRLRILDLWNRYALSIYNRQNSLFYPASSIQNLAADGANLNFKDFFIIDSPPSADPG
jgi:hypothetical protein